MSVLDSLKGASKAKDASKNKSRSKRRRTVLEPGPKRQKQTADSEILDMMTKHPNYARLKVRTLVAGTVLLCKIVGLRPAGLRLALPNGIFGLVPSAEITSNNPQDVYPSGQWIMALVTENSPSLLLTLNPAAINGGCENHLSQTGLALAATVVSLQEKGVVLDVGLKNVQCFLRMDSAATCLGESPHPFQRDECRQRDGFDMQFSAVCVRARRL